MCPRKLFPWFAAITSWLLLACDDEEPGGNGGADQGTDASGDVDAAEEIGADLPEDQPRDIDSDGPDEVTDTIDITEEVDVPAPDFGITVAPELTVFLGDSAELSVVVSRIGGFAEDISVTVAELPTGVTVEDITIGGAASQGALVFEAADDADMDTAEVTVTASAGDIEREATVSLTVRPAPGTPDEDFGEGGVVTLDFEVQDDANAVAVADDGSIYVVGTVNDETVSRMALVRLDEAGEPDADFDEDGLVTSSPPVETSHFGRDLVIQGDGQIVVAGNQTSLTTAFDFLIARYDDEGNADIDGFSGGIVSYNFEEIEMTEALAIDPLGRLVVAGTGGDPMSMAVLRLDDAGARDFDFDDDGYSLPEIGEERDYATGVVIFGGVVVVAGAQSPVDGEDIAAVAFLDEDGALDDGFGDGGWTDIPLAEPSSQFVDIIIFDSQLLALGTVEGEDFLFARFTPGGTLDEAFGEGGVVLHETAESGEALEAMAATPDGGLIAVGLESAAASPLIVRARDDGSLDTTFNETGVLVLDDYPATFHDVVVQHDGKALAVGFVDDVENGGSNMILYRFWP